MDGHCLSSHIPYCIPLHWYIILIACWASRDSLWIVHSLSLAYLFSPRLGPSSYALCIYCLDQWVLWVHLCHCLFVSFLGHSWFLLSYIVHLHFVYLSFVSILSFLFIYVFPYVMMIRSRPRATSQFCHTFRFACRLWSKILRLRGPVRIGGLRFFWLDYASVAFGLLWLFEAKYIYIYILNK